jgi:hypothetical protein
VKKKLSLHQVRVRRLRQLLVIMVVFFISVFVFFWWQTGNKVEEKMLEQIKTQELLTARAGALSLGEYFKPKAVSLLFLAETEEIKTGQQKGGEELIESLVEKLEGEPLVDIVWVDKKGEALWATNLQGERVREEIYLGDRSYFQWAETQEKPGEIFISEPLISSGTLREKESILVMASPIFYQGEFNGTVFISFSIAELTRKYLDPLIFDPEAYLFMMAYKDGTIIATTKEELVGGNILDATKQASWPEKEKEAFQKKAQEALTGKEDVFIHLNYLESNSRKLITAYSPVRVEDQFWSLWVSIPYQEVMKEVRPIVIIRTGVLLVTLIGVIALVAGFVFGVRLAQREAFVKSFRGWRDGIKKKS